jgi:hypothetical protein
MARGSLTGILANYVRRNPKTSAMIAFNLGIYAALAAKKGLAATDLKALQAKLSDLVPSMKDIGSFVPSLAAFDLSKAMAPKRAAPRKSGAKHTATARRATKRTAAKRRAA